MAWLNADHKVCSLLYVLNLLDLLSRTTMQIVIYDYR